MNQSQILLEELAGHDECIRRLVRRLVLDEGAADDAIQEAVTTALEQPPDRGAVEAWLGRVARNAALLARRGDARRRAREMEVAPAEAVPSASEVVERHEQRTILSKAVLALDEPYRTVILYRFYEGQPPREIARNLGVPVETVKSQIQRGLEQLRARLDQQFGGERRAWCVAFLPLIGPSTAKAVAATGGTAAGLTTVGAVIMGAKAKFGFALAVLAIGAVGVGVALPLLQNLRDRPNPSPTGPVPSRESPVAAVAGDSSDDPAVVQAPQVDGLSPGVSPAPGKRISGVVRMIGGRAIADAHVKVVACQRGASSSAETSSDLAGRYSLGPIPDGWVLVEASYPGQFKAQKWGKAGDVVTFLLGEGGCLSGQVTLAKSSTPVVDASVIAYELVVNAFMFKRVLGEFRLREAASARTDENGNYELTDLKPGSYRIAVFPADRAPQYTDWDVAINGGEATRRDFALTGADGVAVLGKVLDQETGASVAGATVQLSSNWRQCCKTGEDGGYRLRGVAPEYSSDSLTVQAHGYVSTLVRIRVTPGVNVVQDVQLNRPLTVSGRVQDTNGRPIPNALVATEASYLGPPCQAWAVRTDENGRYRCRVVPGQTYTMYAAADGLATNCSTPFKARREAPDTVPTITLTAGGQVVGRLLLENGTPVEGGWLRLCDWAEEGRKSGWRDHCVTSSRIGSSGEFRFAGVPSGRYSFAYTARGVNRRLRRKVVTVTDGSVVRTDLEVPTGGKITGIVTDVEGGGQANRVVSAWVQGPGGGGAKTRTKADGSFVIEGLDLARYRVHVLCGTGWTHQPIRDVELGARVRIVMQRGQTIQGVVYQPNGQPAPHFYIQVLRGDEPIRAGTRRLRYSDEAGRFDLRRKLIRTLSGGVWRIRAGDDAGRRSEWLTVRVEGKHVRTASGTEATPAALYLRECSIIEGMVNGVDRKPVAGATVTIESAQPNADRAREITRTDGRGNFRFEGLSEGEYDVLAVHETLQPAAQRIVAGPSGVVRMELILQFGCARTFRVFDKHGVPLEGASVEVEAISVPDGVVTGKAVSRKARPRKSSRTTREGQACVRGLGPGAYEVTTTHRNWVADRRVIDVAPGSGMASHEIRLGGGGELSLKVLSVRGGAVEGAAVVVQTQVGRTVVGIDERRYFALFEKVIEGGARFYWSDYKHRIERTGSGGAWTRKFLSPGTYRVVVRKSGYRDEIAVGVVVAEEKTTAVEIKLTPGD